MNQEFINQIIEEKKPLDRRLNKLAKEVEAELNDPNIMLSSKIANTGTVYIKRVCFDFSIRISDHLAGKSYGNNYSLTFEQVDQKADNEIKDLIRQYLTK